MNGSDTGGDEGERQAPAHRPPRWQRLWVVLCSRFPGLSVGPAAGAVEGEAAAGSSRRLRALGIACGAVALAVVLAGTTVGSLIGAATVGIMRMVSGSEPLVTGDTTPLR